MRRIERHSVYVAAGECAFGAVLTIVTALAHAHEPIDRRERRAAITDRYDMIDKRCRLDASNAFAGFA
jgi:hypothetical protein